MGSKPRGELCWHFLVTVDGRPVLRDGQVLDISKTLRHSGDISICRSGLHASVRAIDALRYAPGPFVTRCRMTGVADRQEDKMVGASRRVLWGYDATKTLSRFARHCASDVLHLWDAPNVVKQYLKTGDETLRAGAWDASDAAWDAARDARDARDAARAALAAARAAWAAVWRARDAADWAAWANDAWADKNAEYNTVLERMLEEGRPGRSEASK